MKRDFVKDLKQGQEALLLGWVYEARDLAKMKFLVIRDATGFVQCIAKDPEIIKKISDITFESVVEIKGIVKKAQVNLEIARHDVEIEISDITVLAKAEKL